MNIHKVITLSGSKSLTALVLTSNKIKKRQKILEIVGNEGERIGGKKKMRPLPVGYDLSRQIIKEFILDTLSLSKTRKMRTMLLKKEVTVDFFENFINKGYQVSIFNKYIEKENYDINYQFYIISLVSKTRE